MQVRKASSLASPRWSGYRNKMKYERSEPSFRFWRPLSQLSLISSINVSLFLLLAFALTVGPATGQQIDRPYSTSDVFVGSTALESRASVEYKVFDLVNLERELHGVRPLKWTDKATTVARFHSDNMATSLVMGHRDQAGRSVSDRAARFGLNNWKQIAENVAWLSGSNDLAERVVRSWMRSPGHRRNIVDARHEETGLGFAMGSDGRYYFTQVFISPR